MKYTLGIDFGGGASKATLLSEKGEVVSTNTVEYPTYYPQNRYVEQNPDDWYKAAKENIKAVLEKSGVNKNDVVCISLDAATHTAVLTDEFFKPLCPSIYWTDTRSIDEVEYLKKNYGKKITAQVLHECGTIWTLPQLLWLKKNKEELYSKVRHIMFAKDYVRHLMTGDYVTDNIEAEGSMLFDYNKQEWSKDLCDLVGINLSLLPEIVHPSDTVGYITKEAANDVGLKEGTQVICGCTDTAMEIFAAGCVNTGDVTLKLATAGRICVITDKAYPDKNLINYSYVIPGLWYPGTATKSCASSYRWFRDTFGGDYKELDREAEKVKPGASGITFHPYLNGELTPYNDPSLCASFIGVRAEHTKGHFARAVLEGVSLSMLDSKKAMEKAGIYVGNKAVIIGGGSKSQLWRQITSDVLNMSFISRKYSDSSFGSAILAGLAAGFWNDPKDALNCCNEDLFITVPNFDRHEQYMRLYKKYKDVADALTKIYHTQY